MIYKLKSLRNSIFSCHVAYNIAEQNEVPFAKALFFV